MGRYRQGRSLAAALSITLAAATLLAVGGSPVVAQESGGATAVERGGFHFSIGLGGGSASATCDLCEVDFFEDRLMGISGNLQLGGMATSRLAIAAEFMGWIKNDPPIYRRIAALSLVLLGYPSETAGFFVKAGAGGLRAIAEDDFILVQTDAWTAQGGIGYDIRLGGHSMLTAYGNYIRTFGGVTDVNDVRSPVTLLPNVIQFGLALTIH